MLMTQSTERTRLTLCASNRDGVAIILIGVTTVLCCYHYMDCHNHCCTVTILVLLGQTVGQYVRGALLLQRRWMACVMKLGRLIDGALVSVCGLALKCMKLQGDCWECYCGTWMGLRPTSAAWSLLQPTGRKTWTLRSSAGLLR